MTRAPETLRRMSSAARSPFCTLRHAIRTLAPLAPSSRAVTAPRPLFGPGDHRHPTRLIGDLGSCALVRHQPEVRSEDRGPVGRRAVAQHRILRALDPLAQAGRIEHQHIVPGLPLGVEAGDLHGPRVHALALRGPVAGGIIDLVARRGDLQLQGETDGTGLQAPADLVLEELGTAPTSAQRIKATLAGLRDERVAHEPSTPTGVHEAEGVDRVVRAGGVALRRQQPAGVGRQPDRSGWRIRNSGRRQNTEGVRFWARTNSRTPPACAPESAAPSTSRGPSGSRRAGRA